MSVLSSDRVAWLPTAPLAATGLIAGFGVAVASGSRPLGGLVLAGFGAACAAISARRDPRAVTTALLAVGFAAFVASHALGLVIGSWPAVLVCAAATAVACDRLSDAGMRAARLRS
jgi:hypothetical protein